ncbi:MAG: hypothetical protein HY318_15800, partial [Armatimonadetes bacterium]|nr:hypothetical protein [Armatimonadota bacterium]
MTLPSTILPGSAFQFWGIEHCACYQECLPEGLLLRAFGLHRADLTGKPDLTLSRYGTVIFVHGCFWHRHKGCRFA